jgi:hypothetical protein
MHTSATANAGITKRRGAELISGLSNRAEPGTLGGKQHGRIDDLGTYSAPNVYWRVSRFIKGTCRLLPRADHLAKAEQRTTSK